MRTDFNTILMHIMAYANFLKTSRNITLDDVCNLDEFLNHIDYQIESKSELSVEHSRDSLLSIIKNHLISNDPTEIAAVDERLENWVGSSENQQTFTGDHYNHYVQSLIESGKSSIIGQLNQDTFTILDCCANPKTNSLFDRRGLVYGHVQSGKTANYLGLISRAYDHGYKIVIVFAGLNEDLRQQTQERIEHSILLESKNLNYKIRRATSVEYDFAGIANHTDLTAADRSIWIVKKNKIVLENIIDWFSEQAKKLETTLFQEPILIIDDEADNASIQSLTASEFRTWETGMELAQIDIEDLTVQQAETLEEAHNRHISTINRLIRVLLSTLGKKTFVQYTATPYSVINQTSEDLQRTVIVKNRPYTLTNNDLFPEHFIIPLKAGKSYFGVDRTFNTNVSKNIPFLRNISLTYPNESLEQIFTTKKDTHFWFDIIPESLQNSIQEFLVTIVIKKFRKINDHNSMLIHTTFKTDDINYLASKVKDYLKYTFTECQQPRSKSISEMNSILDRLKLRSQNPLYREYFSLNGIFPEKISSIDINLIQNDARQPFSTVAYHSGSNESLDFNSRDEKKNKKYKNYIIIGGNKLARGLTIEGLNTTYFTRNSTRRDSLYQMARWFGYRSGFEDLVSLYTTDKTYIDYQSIFIIEKHLRDDFEINMERECPILPKNAIIKLAISSHEIQGLNRKLPFPCDPNKLRKTIQSNLDSTGHTRTSQFEKIYIKEYEANLHNSIDFIQHLDTEYSLNKFDYTGLPKHISRNVSFTKIPASEILNYLQSLFHRGKMATDFNLLREFISKNSELLNNWSVSIINRSNNASFIPAIIVGDQEIKTTKYNASNDKMEDLLKFGAILARQAGDSSFDLLHADENIYSEQHAKQLRQQLGIPLILIYPNFIPKDKGYFTEDVKFPIIDVYIPHIAGLEKIKYTIRRTFNNN